MDAYAAAMLVDLQQKAEQDLRFIRQAMERVEGVSSVSGLGGMLMGVVALVAALVAAQQAEFKQQLTVWIYAAFVAVVTGGVACWRKGIRGGSVIHWDPVRRFLACLVPAVVVAAALTIRLWDRNSELIAPIWMMLYGCGVLAAGTYAVRAVLIVGGCFVVAGLCALWLPVAWTNQLLALCFGGLHIIFGWWLFKHHGG